MFGADDIVVVGTSDGSVVGVTVGVKFIRAVGVDGGAFLGSALDW